MNMKITFQIVTILIAGWISWIYLPEMFYTVIAKNLKINILHGYFYEINKVKIEALIAIVAGLLFLFTPTFQEYNKKLMYYVLGYFLIFLGFFMGIVFCFLIYGNNEGGTSIIDLKNCFNFFIVIISIFFFLFCGNLILKRLDKNP